MHHCAPALLAVPLLALALAGLAQGKGSKLPRITIAPGVDMPMVNCGHPDAGCQHGLGPGCAAAAQNMSMMWLRLGGRGLDTAFGYDNQAQVGAAVKAAIAQNLANRSDVFITTKINPDKQGGCTQEAALAAIRQDVQQLGVHYVDLVLQHFPCATDAQNQAVWSGLALAKKLGLARSVGVSHYGVADLRAIMALNKGAPAVNQCGMYVGSHDDETMAFCKSNGITYEAYGALRDVDLSDKRLVAIAQAHNVSTAQVALRWITQQGCPVAVSPGLNAGYATEDLYLGGFTLTISEMATLSAI